MTAIAGTKVTLRRARDTDRARIYEWHIGSDLTVNLMGSPMFPDRPIPVVRAVLAVVSAALLRGHASVRGAHVRHHGPGRGDRLHLARRN